MASSSFTANLGLCQWAAQDKPKRADFVSDNAIIDSAIGTHTANTAIHLSPEERAKLDESFVIVSYSGTGEASYSYIVGFQPKLVIVFKKNAPPVSLSGGNTIVSAAVSAYGAGGSEGVVINSSGFVVSQRAAANGVALNLNELDEPYTAVVFK